jgi:hypothetical protein
MGTRGFTRRPRPIAASGGALDPEAGDLELTVGSGHAGKGGVTMPGKGKITLTLSYREKDLLGRSLSVGEVRYVTEVARRIAAILVLGPSLDAN